MDARAEKLAKARKKLRDHQEKKINHIDDNLKSPQKDVHPNVDHSKNDMQHIGLEIPLENIIETRDELDKTVSDELKNDDDVKQSFSRAVMDTHTEYLLSNQNNLEIKIGDLQKNLAEVNEQYAAEINSHNKAKQKVFDLEQEIKNMTSRYHIYQQDSNTKDVMIKELKTKIELLKDENNNITEQIEFTKELLKTKESEYTNLHNQACSYYNQLETTKLQIQQLTSDTTVNVNTEYIAEKEYLVKNINVLEQKVNALQQEKDNLTSHYEHYVKDLSEQLKSTLLRNEDLSKELNRLHEREHSLVEQIGDMEIRLQNFNKKDFEIETQCDTSELQKQISLLKETVEENKKIYNALQKQHEESLIKIQELETNEKSKFDHDNISMEKLTADITSDKIAAQKATEQNMLLKTDVEDLQQVIVKMTKDKLELTEKLAHDKNLNKELILKLADIEEKGKDVHTKLLAKDVEMIRLQNEFRDMERKYLQLQNNHLDMLSLKEKNIQSNENDLNNLHDVIKEQDNLITEANNNNTDTENLLSLNSDNDRSGISDENMEKKSSCCIPKVDAMFKLQERFTRIMDEVANLSDEKHRLEHIILQLQNETDTICEYVALYQQQRSLLRKRDEERNHQLKIFEKECNELKRHLDELRQLFLRLADDKEIIVYLNKVAKHDDLVRINELLETLQNSSLVSHNLKNLGLESFYPCSCCSGKLIEV